jgi:hypothetical protein
MRHLREVQHARACIDENRVKACSRAGKMKASRYNALRLHVL